MIRCNAFSIFITSVNRAMKPSDIQRRRCEPRIGVTTSFPQFRSSAPRGRWGRTLAVATLLALQSTAGLSQPPSQNSEGAPPASTMERLIRGLIDSGALDREIGEALLAQAKVDAMAERKADRQAKTPTVAEDRTGKSESSEVRVPYIPEVVRDQMRDELRTEVLAQAKSERWAAPDQVPEWTQRLTFSGDVRVRNESRLFADDNSTIEIDWAAINEGSGFDINSGNLTSPPVRNYTESQYGLWRVRARLGVVAALSDQVSAGIRVATGGDNDPVSTNQTMGGGLAKKDIWVDQAWIAYQPFENLRLVGGRFENPFVSTDLLYDNDLNFDGAAAQLKMEMSSGLSIFANAATVPLEYEGDSHPATFSTNDGQEIVQPAIEEKSKWLLGVQAGFNLSFSEHNKIQAAIAFYDFANVNGLASRPCDLYAGATVCTTDWTRPAYMQKGNTLMLLRDVAVNPLDPQFTPEPQYGGLASEFQLLDLNLRWDTRLGRRMDLRLETDYVVNLAFDEDEIWARSRGRIVNNFGPSGSITRDSFESGDVAWMLRATLGSSSLSAPGDRQMVVGYKYIEPDALLDAFTDSDFHLGGTNAEGYFLGGAYGFARGTSISVRWLSAKEVFGPPLKVDVLQLDINTRF